MAAGNIITLTEKVSGTVVEISEDALISMVGVDSANDSLIRYTNNNRTVVNTLFDDTIAAVIVVAPKMLAFTEASDSSTTYINGARIKTSYIDGSGSITKVDTEKAAWEIFKLEETPTEVQTAVNA